MQIKYIMDDKKVKELEERLRNRVRYNVGMDTASPKKKQNNDYYEKDYCEDMGNRKHSKCVCDSDNPDCHVKAYRVPMTYEDFMQVVSDIFGMPFDRSYTRLRDALQSAKELEKYITRKDEFYKNVSAKFKDIENHIANPKKDKYENLDDTKPIPLVKDGKKYNNILMTERAQAKLRDREEKEKELIERLKENMSNVKSLMDRVGDRKQAEYIPTGKVEDIEKEKDIDSNVIKGAKTYMTSTKIFDEILETMRKTYYAKNTDYGSSFDKGIDRYGWTSFKTRIFDKFNRVETILDKKESDPDYKPLVQDEKLEDTLLDMANYAILAIIYLRTHQQ